MRRTVPLPVLLGTVSCQGKVLQLGNDPAPYHFGPPVLVPELAYSAQTDNPTFTSDMLEVFFTTRRDKTTGVDVWLAKRTNTAEPFGTPSPVPKVNSDGFETSSADDIPRAPGQHGLVMPLASSRASM